MLRKRTFLLVIGAGMVLSALIIAVTGAVTHKDLFMYIAVGVSTRIIIFACQLIIRYTDDYPAIIKIKEEEEDTL